MLGYTASTYGDRFVDVYDDWYEEVTDTKACVRAIADLAAGGDVLELGVGTGRLAIPLAQQGVPTVGLDVSPAMLAALAAKPGGSAVSTVLGDMSDPEAVLGERRFSVVLVAFNTLFNLVNPADQHRCLEACRRLAPGGLVVIEAFVPDPTAPPTGAVTPRRITTDQVVLSVSESDPVRQEVMGQYIEITEAGIRLRPWQIRWSTPDQVDAMALEAGLELKDRWADWDRTPFGAADPTHITLYRSPS